MSTPTPIQTLTPEEHRAIEREIAYLIDEAPMGDERFKNRALAGPCFCAGRFVCTKCGLQKRAS